MTKYLLTRRQFSLDFVVNTEITHLTLGLSRINLPTLDDSITTETLLMPILDEVLHTVDDITLKRMYSSGEEPLKDEGKQTVPANFDKTFPQFAGNIKKWMKKQFKKSLAEKLSKEEEGHASEISYDGLLDKIEVHRAYLGMSSSDANARETDYRTFTFYLRHILYALQGSDKTAEDKAQVIMDLAIANQHCSTMDKDILSHWFHLHVRKEEEGRSFANSIFQVLRDLRSSTLSEEFRISTDPHVDLQLSRIKKQLGLERFLPEENLDDSLMKKDKEVITITKVFAAYTAYRIFLNVYQYCDDNRGEFTDWLLENVPTGSDRREFLYSCIDEDTGQISNAAIIYLLRQLKIFK